MNHKKRTLTVILSAVFIATGSLGVAQNAQDVAIAPAIQENAQERINFSGKLRMLSQRIPSAACHLSRGIAVENAVALLAGSTVEFEQILNALEFGDEDLNIILPETRRKSLVQIHALRALWEPFKAAADEVIAGTTDESHIQYLMAENLTVLGAAQKVVEELTQQYSNPNAVTQASLMLIDISGRQRMLTQKMSKETCMIDSGVQTDATIADLHGTVQVFEASLDALRFGMPAVGILPPPNAEISEGLIVVLDDWNGAKPMITTIAEGGTLDAAAHATKFDQLNVTMSSMNTVVEAYASATKQ